MTFSCNIIFFSVAVAQQQLLQQLHADKSPSVLPRFDRGTIVLHSDLAR